MNVSDVEGPLLDAVAVAVGTHVLEQGEQLVLLDAVERNTVAGPHQQRILAERLVALGEIVAVGIVRPMSW